MTDSKELNAAVNPTSNTAITTLILLANAGYEKASEILKRMGIEKETFFRETDPDDMINRPSDIVRELRYVALNRTIKETGYRNLMDLPCGYTPKVFEFTAKGMNYNGCDLPAVINDFAPLVESMADDEIKNRIQFSIVDVTNYESMKAAADKLEGAVCIATEGLTVYLSTEENAQLFRNIRRILQEKGGCWLNADAETVEYYMAVYKAVAREKAGELMRAVTRGFGGQSDTNFVQQHAGVAKQSKEGSWSVDYEAIKAVYTKLGLRVEKIPYYRDDLQLRLYSKMSDDEIERLKENMKHVHVWKVTADPDFDESKESRQKTAEIENLPFEVKSEAKDGVLSVSIQGRMDTLTAPELLKQFQEAGKAEEIRIDVSRMAYVSSAGLRVLLMMYKSLEDKDRFELNGVNDAVREILETTGFDQFLLKDNP